MMTSIIEARPCKPGKPVADLSYTKEEAKKLLPKVGDRLIHTATVSDKYQAPRPEECVVIFVHTEHLWYMVKYKDGFRECFKVPLQK